MTKFNKSLIDKLGMLQAQITNLEAEENALKNEIRSWGAGSFDGEIFRATVGADSYREQLDAKAAREKLLAEGFHDFVKKNTRRIPVKGSVKAVARNGDKEAA